MKRKTLLVGILAAIIVFITAPSALAADANITSGGTYDIANALYGNDSTLTVQTTDAVIFTQSNATTAVTGFQIRCTVENADITIDGVNIDNSSNSGTIPIAFNASGCTLTASGINYLTAGYFEPAIRILNTNSLNILGDASSEIHATGGSRGVGIGGGQDDTAGFITISSGTIVATGGTYAAGIGSSISGHSGTTTINGTANVTATGGYRGAGIGGGYILNGGTINIAENAIVAATGGDSSAGIGGGAGANGGTINISGGTITATGGSGAVYAGGAGIGSGSEGDNGGTINISGGTIVSAKSNGRGAGIGGGYNSSGGTITITGGTITYAGGGSHGAGIGGGYQEDAGTINISGGTITNAKGGSYAPGIGTGKDGLRGTIELTGGNITANGGSYASGIGSSCSNSSYNKVTITINGATVNATGGTMAAGIGTGNNSYDNNSNYTTINIIDGTVTANGGDRGAGIGGGYYSEGGIINISGGTITAKGGNYATSHSGAGIGGGGSYNTDVNGGTINISGGTITATGGYCAAGIGGGTAGDGGNIKISGGNVTARGGKGNASYGSGAGIGGGGEGDGGIITISGGRVDAKGNYFNDASGVYTSCGIGGGYGVESYFKTATINISGGQVFGDAGYIYGGYDIGSFYGTLSISGTAAVFSKNNTFEHIIVNTYSHTKYTNETITGGMAYGYTVPSGWSGTAYAYLIGYTVNYESGVSGSISGVSSETVFYGTNPRNVPTATPDSGSSFDGWHDGENIYVDLSAYEVTGPVTFTAVFNPTPVTGITITPESATLILGDANTANDTIDLDEEISPAYATNQSVAWQSSDTLVATVDSNGLVVAVAAGSATITATTDDGGFEDTCTITVEQRVAGVSLDITSATLILDDADATNDTVQLTETVSPDSADNKVVSWSSADETVATVDANGLVTAVGAGNTDITVTTDDGGFTAECNISVEQSVTGVVLSYSEMTIELGDTAELNCTVEPADTTDKTTTWTSGNIPVASVSKDTDERGTVTANAVGVAYITVTTNNGGYTDICKVTVVDMTTYAVSKYGGLTGNLLQNDGATGIGNWNVTLYSTPVSATTNASGAFSYSGVQYSHHTLVFTDNTGAEFDRYTLNFSAGSTTGYSISGDIITINYTSRTTSIDMDFTMDTTGTEFLLSDVAFSQMAVNPQTGEKGVELPIVLVVAVALLFLSIALGFVYIKSLKRT
ncbi:MAG: Ig domain-containing protein [Clostridia bacterium]|nr:Ig domain-containing protein [Clostridia bacterium]